MEHFIDSHPFLFTILAFPAVVTACLILLSVCGLEFHWQRGK